MNHINRGTGVQTKTKQNKQKTKQKSPYSRQTSRARSFARKNKNMFGTRLAASNPFESPLVLTRKLIIEPIRRQYVNSTRMFLAENYVVNTAFEASGFRSRSTKSTTSTPPPACLLSDVYEQYQWYCMQQDLTAVPRSEFLQYLVGTCELRVKTIWFECVRGLFWLKEPAAPSEPLLPGSSREKVIAAFFETYLDYTNNPKTDVVDLTAYPNTPIEDRENVLLHRLRVFCEASGCDVPRDWQDTTTGAPQLSDEIEKMFPDLEVVKIRFREIVGLEPRRRGGGGRGRAEDDAEDSDDDDDDDGWFDRGRLSFQFVAIEALTVLTHVCIMFSVPCLAMWHVMRIQTVYSVTTAMGSPLRSTHLLQLPFQIEGKQVMPLVTTFAWLQVSFMCVCFLRVFIHYLDMREDSRRRRYTYKFFGVIIYLYCLVMFTYVAVLVMWLLLASVLRPTSLMPYGCAVVSLLLLPVYMSRRMSKAAAGCRQSLRDFLDAQVIDSVKTALMRRTQEQKLSRGGSGASGASAGGSGDGGPKDDEARTDEANARLISDAWLQGKVTAADIFKAVDVDNSDGINMEELADYMKQMDIKMSPMRLERLFAYCDTDGSGSISQMEFEQGWEYIIDEMANDLLETVGLSANHQMVTILLLFTVALLVIGFLFLAIYSYNNEDSFASSVQSMLVVASSTAVTNSKKSIDQDPKTLNKKIGEFLQEDVGDKED